MDDEIKDWETLPGEDPPEQLKRKWIEEQMKGLESRMCPSCRQVVSGDAVICHFCGSPISRPDIGFLSKIAFWVKKLFGWKG